MQDILELKHKVMQEKLHKQIDRVIFCYIENENNKSNSLFTLAKTLQTKYEECYQRIRSSKKINKSIKYEQLEEIVFQELNKIEYIMMQNIIEHKRELEELIKKKFKSLEEIEDFQKRIEEIEKIKGICSYFKNYINQEEIRKLYIKSKFDAYIEKSKMAFFEKQEECNAFKEIEDEDELKELKICMEQEVLKQARILIHQINLIYFYRIKNEKLEELKRRVLVEIELLNTKNKELKRLKLKLGEGIKIKTKKTKALWQEELIENFLITDIEQNIKQNRKYVSKLPFFDIHKLCVTEEQEKKYSNSARFKMLYTYLTQMAEDRNYSIEEIREVLKRFKVYDEKNIELLCKEYAMDYILDEIHIIRRYSIQRYRIINKPISLNLVKVNLTPNEYINLLGVKKEKFEIAMITHDDINGLLIECGKDEIVIDTSVDIYEKTIANGLNRLNIWNKLLAISNKPDYEIAISLDDFEQIPIDKTKLEVIQDKQIQLEYLEYRIKELKNLIEYGMPDECYVKRDYEILIEEYKWNLTFFGDSGQLDSEICTFNKTKDKIVQEIEQIGLSKIIKYEQERLGQIDKNSSFNQQMEELEKINCMIKQIETQTGDESLYNNYLIKKFQILVKEIIKCRNVDTPSKKRILEAIVYPYCTEEEKSMLDKEVKKIIEYIVILKKDYIPREADLESGFEYVYNKMRYLDRDYYILDEIYEVREIILEEFRKEIKLEDIER